MLFYRDNNILVGTIPFHSGLVATCVDNLTPNDGLTHYYTYSYIDYNGNESARSSASETVTAKSIDTTLIDKETFKQLSNAWVSEFITDGGVMGIEQLKTDIKTQAENTILLANQLAAVQDNYDAMFNQYKLLVNEFSLISAKVNEKDDAIEDITKKEAQC